MKILTYISSLFITILLVSCSGDSDDPLIEPINELIDVLKVQDFANETHTIEMYTINGKLTQGYNEIVLRIKDKNTDELVENASIEWLPMMHMVDKMHSCPRSNVNKVSGKKTIYGGYIIFQMPENQDESWVLTINYTINGMEFQVEGDISVPMSDKKEVAVFTGMDEVKYILALVGPQNPDVKVNDITVGLFKMENMLSFPVVENYGISMDPRMPSMGNHSSPNNVDPAYNIASNMYEGKLSLTMTGYWKLNFMLYNTSDELLKGEEVTDENEDSNLYLEIEF